MSIHYVLWCTTGLVAFMKSENCQLSECQVSIEWGTQNITSVHKWKILFLENERCTLAESLSEYVNTFISPRECWNGNLKNGKVQKSYLKVSVAVVQTWCLLDRPLSYTCTSRDTDRSSPGNESIETHPGHWFSMYPWPSNGLHEQKGIRAGWLGHELAPLKPTDTQSAHTQPAFSWLLRS